MKILACWNWKVCLLPKKNPVISYTHYRLLLKMPEMPLLNIVLSFSVMRWQRVLNIHCWISNPLALCETLKTPANFRLFIQLLQSNLLPYPREEIPSTWNHDHSANRAINMPVCMLVWVCVIVFVKISPVTALCSRQIKRFRITATSACAMRGCQCPCFHQQPCIILSLPQQRVRQAVFLSILLWAWCTVRSRTTWSCFRSVAIGRKDLCQLGNLSAFHLLT